MLIKDFENILEEYAPQKLKEDYDNVGLMVGDKNSEISGIMVSLDCTLDVINEAVVKNCNLIFTHHPLLFRKPSNITTDTLLGNKIIKLIKSDLNLYSSHTNLDSTFNGINDLLVEVLGYESESIIEKSKQDCNSGIGRIVRIIEPITLQNLCSQVKQKLDIDYLRYSGDLNSKIEKIAIINGSGQDYFNIAKRMGADCIITGDTTYHYISDFNEEGINVIDAGHFKTEWLSFKNVCNILEHKIIEKGFNIKFNYSNVIEDPYKYL
jgi:dinuclear metal center YbgI/SA1388 family protein